MLLPLGRSVREILDRFRLPDVADEIGQQRHEREALGRGKFWQAHISVDLHVPEPINEREPFRDRRGSAAAACCSSDL